MKSEITDIYESLQQIAWNFGNHGINGECCGDLSLVEFIALKKINESPNYSIQEIGNYLNFTKSGATRIIDRLENKGYAKREHSPIDGRVCCVSITNKGKQTVIEAVQKNTTYIEEILKNIEDQKLIQIKEALDILVKAVRFKDFI